MAAAAQVIPQSPTKTSRTPEFDLLCACCRHDASSAVLAALCSETAWDRVLTLASHHRVLPQLCSALRRNNEVLASIQSALHSSFSAHNRRVLRFTAQLVAILRQFQTHGIEAILHKGPALAQRLYNDALMREFGDLDFLIRAKDIPRAGEALCELGFRPHLQLSSRQERAYLRTGYEYAFTSDLGPNLIELQWQIVPRFYSIAFQPEELFQRSVEIEFEGQSARILKDEDLLLALCVHAAKHCWAQLGMLRDIAALARRPIDWQWIAAKARQLGIVRILTASLVLSRNLLGSELPSEFAVNPELQQSEKFAGIIQKQMIRGGEPDTESLDYFRFMMRLRESWRHRLLFAKRLAFTPGVSEWNSIRLPDALFPLYRGIRVLRLFKRAFSF